MLIISLIENENSSQLIDYNKHDFFSTGATKISKNNVKNELIGNYNQNFNIPIKQKKSSINPILQINFKKKRKSGTATPIILSPKKVERSTILESKKKEMAIELRRKKLDEEKIRKVEKSLKKDNKKKLQQVEIIIGNSRKGGKKSIVVPKQIKKLLKTKFNPLSSVKKEEQKKLISKIVDAFMSIDQIDSLKRSSSMPNNLPPFQKLGITGIKGITNKYPKNKIELPDPNDPKLIKIDAFKKKFKSVVKQEMKEFVNEHSKCGEVCVHLKRFYERLSLIYANFNNEKGDFYKMNRVVIDKIADVEDSVRWKKRKREAYLKGIVEES